MAAKTSLETHRRELEAEAQRLRAQLNQAVKALDEFDKAHPFHRVHEWGPRFRTARQTLGLSQRMLARISGVSPSTVMHAEHGDRDLTVWTVIRIADVLGVTAGCRVGAKSLVWGWATVKNRAEAAFSGE